MSPPLVLRGTTWRHVRGLAPLASASQAYADLHPGLEIRWETHPVRQFGAGPLGSLAANYDLVCFDHPLVGGAADAGVFLPLDEHLPASELADLKTHSAGPSYASYNYAGRQWGLPIDAASIACATRPDLLAAHGAPPPSDWAGLVALARQPGLVAQGFSPLTCTALLFTFCAQLGKPAFASCQGAAFASQDVLETALERLAELYRVAGGEARLAHGSIQLLAEAAAGAHLACVPYAYGYSTHARPGFAPHPLRFHPFPRLEGAHAAHGGVVGGVGLAVSAHSQHREAALGLARWLASPTCQRTVYAVCGGQPADRRAWNDDLPNQLTGGFYRALLPSLDAGWLRPNGPRFHHFQNYAGDLLHDFLRGGASLTTTATALRAAAAPCRGGA